MLLGQNTRVKWRITLDGDTLALGEATTSASGTSAICVSTAGAFALRDPLNAVGASLLRCIVSSLPLRARLVCASVSKGWHAALGGFVALTSLDLSTASFPLQCSASDALRRALPKHGRTLTELRLRGTDKDDALLLAVAQACPRLRLLDLHDRRNIFVAPKNDEEDEESDEEEEEAGFMAAVSVLYAASRPEDTLTLLLEGSGLFHCGRHGGSARCNHLIHTTINTLRARASMRVTPLAATPWLRLDVACCSAAIDAVFMGGHAETPFFRGISRCCGCGFARCFACEPDALGQTGERRPMGCASCAACRQAEKEDGGSSESERGAMKAHDAEKACEEMVAAADRAAPAAAEAQADADALELALATQAQKVLAVLRRRWAGGYHSHTWPCQTRALRGAACSCWNQFKFQSGLAAVLSPYVASVEAAAAVRERANDLWDAASCAARAAACAASARGGDD